MIERRLSAVLLINRKNYSLYFREWVCAGNTKTHKCAERCARFFLLFALKLTTEGEVCTEFKHFSQLIHTPVKVFFVPLHHNY